MKTVMISFFLLAGLISTLLAQLDTAKVCNLVVQVTGIENDDGKLMIALSNTKEDYDKRGEAFRGGAAEIKDGAVFFTFQNIPAGEYAIKVFHDEDGDRELDTGFLGIPSEDYGFSNNAPGIFGPASWEDAKFLLNTENDTIWISLD